MESGIIRSPRRRSLKQLRGRIWSDDFFSHFLCFALALSPFFAFVECIFVKVRIGRCNAFVVFEAIIFIYTRGLEYSLLDNW